MKPRKIGRMTLFQHLATGGMAEVYLARLPGVAGFSKQVVVKLIREELLDDQQFVQMFLHEGKISALINHLNVVQIFDLGQVDGAFFMAMEYVEGQDLSKLIHRHQGPLDLDIALHILLNVCEGLAYAQGVVGPDGQPLKLVHRDLTPQNILIGYAGSVKITDFGIAKVQMLHREETRVGMIKGKFGYLSPEQARGERVDHRSDIYALGLLLFEMTTGVPPLGEASDTDKLLLAARGHVRKPSAYVRGYPPALEQIFIRATAAEPKDRFQTVLELQEALLTYQIDHRLVIRSGELAELMGSLFGEEMAQDRALAARGVTSDDDLASTQLDHSEQPAAAGGPEEGALRATVPLPKAEEDGELLDELRDTDPLPQTLAERGYDQRPDAFTEVASLSQVFDLGSKPSAPAPGPQGAGPQGAGPQGAGLGGADALAAADAPAAEDGLILMMTDPGPDLEQAEEQENQDPVEGRLSPPITDIVETPRRRRWIPLLLFVILTGLVASAVIVFLTLIEDTGLSSSTAPDAGDRDPIGPARKPSSRQLEDVGLSGSEAAAQDSGAPDSSPPTPDLTTAPDQRPARIQPTRKSVRPRRPRKPRRPRRPRTKRRPRRKMDKDGLFNSPYSR